MRILICTYVHLCICKSRHVSIQVSIFFFGRKGVNCPLVYLYVYTDIVMAYIVMASIGYLYVYTDIVMAYIVMASIGYLYVYTDISAYMCGGMHGVPTCPHACLHTWTTRMSTRISARMSTHRSTRMSTRMSTHLSTHLSAHLSTHMSAHLSTNLHTCPHTCLHPCLHARPHTFLPRRCSSCATAAPSLQPTRRSCLCAHRPSPTSSRRFVCTRSSC